MNTLTLLNLTLENFKGLRHFEASLDGHNARICGENGTGKTTLYDGWLWLLFGKDSTGRKDFGIRSVDTNSDYGKVIKGLVLVVEADVVIDAQRHRLRKDLHERVVKDQLRGYETYC